MNKNTENKTENKELKPYTPKQPLVPEESLMTEAEIKEFVRSMLMESDYEHYALDGFIFLFKTFGEMANQSQTKAIDLCNDLQTFIYQETIHCHLSGDKYNETIHERYRKTDYTEENIKLYQTISQEIAAAPQAAAENNVLDLSSSSVEGLAQSLSQLMHNPNLPTSVYNCLADEFAQTDVDTNSPENILKNLKKAAGDE